MANLKEIDDMGLNAFTELVLAQEDSRVEEKFNKGIPLEEQIKKFTKFQPSEDSYMQMIKDAELFN